MNRAKETVDICFVPSFLTPSEAKDPSSAPLGVLTLAGILEDAGFDCAVIDGSSCFRPEYKDRFVDALKSVTCRILETHPKIVGFSAMCSSLPVSIMIAEQIREQRPNVKIIFGGPQPSVVAADLLRAFPFVDVIYIGEADREIVGLVRAMSGTMSNTRALADIPGAAYRDEGRIVINSRAPLIENLDELAIPRLGYISCDWGQDLAIEAGRGCPFACTFCSTSHFWKRRFRLKSSSRLLSEMDHFSKRHGICTFHLMHDLFTVNRKEVEKFCSNILNSGKKFAWTCSSRIDTIDTHLVRHMAEAGCTQIYFGIETGSQRLQDRIKKKLDLSHLSSISEAVEAAGIFGVYSFVAGLPDEQIIDLRETLDTVIHLSRLKNVDIQCHLLTPLPGTPIFPKDGQGLTYEPTWSDATLPVRSNAMERLIRAHPGLFSSYYRFPNPGIPANWLRHFPALVTALSKTPITLNESMACLNINPIRLLSSWASSCATPESPTPDGLLLHVLELLMRNADSRRPAISVSRVLLRGSNPSAHYFGRRVRMRSKSITLHLEHGDGPVLVFRTDDDRIRTISQLSVDSTNSKVMSG